MIAHANTATERVTIAMSEQREFLAQWSVSQGNLRRFLEDLLQQHDLKQCTAYSDSINDLPMLEMVGSPVAVNPDRALRRHAKAQGWAVRDYRPVRRAVRLSTLPVLSATGEFSLWRLWSKRQDRTHHV